MAMCTFFQLLCTKKWISPFECAILPTLNTQRLIHISATYSRFFERIFLISLCMLAFGISTSHILTSISQFGFGLAVFAVPDYLTKLKRLIKNPVALTWLGLYLLFMLGGFQSENTDYFLKDIRTKMPLWVLPVALAFMPPLSRRQHTLVLHFFVAGCLVASLAGVYNLFFGDIVDRRELSPLLSHIRLGIYLVISCFFILRFMITRDAERRLLPAWVYLPLFIFFVFWLFYLKSLTAVVFFVILFPPVLLFFILRRANSKLKYAGIAVFTLVFLGSVIYVADCVKSFYEVNEEAYESLPTHTKLGNLYYHDTSLKATENGNYIYRYQSVEEMRQVWNTRSTISYDSLDKKGNKLQATLIRFLASKNLTRDAEGVNALSEKDIRSVENGIPNYLYAQAFNIKGRIYETLWELEVYQGSGDPNGKSLSARIELWKAGWHALKISPVVGFGTGDVRETLKHSLRSRDSKMVYYGQFGVHNQYLSTALAIGLLGLFWMVFSFVSPFVFSGYKPSFLFYVALALLMLSALNEDIFETQASVTFFAFIYHFLLADSAEKEPAD